MPFSLSVRVLSGHNLPSTANGAYCSMTVWSSDLQSRRGQAPKCTSIHYAQANKSIEWNEKLELSVANPAAEMLTVRLKDRSDSLLGSCSVSLSHMTQGQPLSQWFQLHPSGHLLLKVTLNAVKTTPEPTQPTNMFAMFQTIQKEQQKVLTEQLKQSQAASSQSTANYLQSMANQRQNTYDQINQQLRQHQQAHQRSEQQFLDQLNHNLRQHQQAQNFHNYAQQQQQQQQYPFAANPQYNQNNGWDAVRQGVGIAVELVSLANNFGLL